MAGPCFTSERRAQSVQVVLFNERDSGVSAARAFWPSLSEPGVTAPATAGCAISYLQAQPGLLGIALSLAGEAVPLQAWLVRPKEYTAWCPCGKFWAPGRPASPRFKAIAVQAHEVWGRWTKRKDASRQP